MASQVAAVWSAVQPMINAPMRNKVAAAATFVNVAQGVSLVANQLSQALNSAWILSLGNAQQQINTLGPDAKHNVNTISHMGTGGLQLLTELVVRELSRVKAEHRQAPYTIWLQTLAVLLDSIRSHLASQDTFDVGEAFQALHLLVYTLNLEESQPFLDQPGTYFRGCTDIICDTFHEHHPSWGQMEVMLFSCNKRMGGHGHLHTSKRVDFNVVKPDQHIFIESHDTALGTAKADISDKIAAMDLEGDQPGKGDYTAGVFRVGSQVTLMNARGQHLYKSAWSIRGPRFAGPAGAGDVRYLWTLSHPRLFGGWSRLDFLPFVVGDTVIFSHTMPNGDMLPLCTRDDSSGRMDLEPSSRVTQSCVFRVAKVDLVRFSKP